MIDGTRVNINAQTIITANNTTNHYCRENMLILPSEAVCNETVNISLIYHKYL